MYYVLMSNKLQYQYKVIYFKNNKLDLRRSLMSHSVFYAHKGLSAVADKLSTTLSQY
jgi:hypothetical protein